MDLNALIEALGLSAFRTALGYAGDWPIHALSHQLPTCTEGRSRSGGRRGGRRQLRLPDEF